MNKVELIKEIRNVNFSLSDVREEPYVRNVLYLGLKPASQIANIVLKLREEGKL